ncbi:MAG: arylsulfatase A-like enzyme [Myxococcota bacterium]|jgi:arylsulfatase A-like enzyme
MIVLMLACAPAPTPPNLVLISIDGLRADRTGIGGNPNAPTPNLDRLAREGTWFSQAFSQSNESLFSHAALLTGRYVSELAVPDYRTFLLPDDALLISELLGLYGYSTAAFVAGGHIRAGYGFDQGSSVFDDTHDFGTFFHKTPQALEWVRERAREPFFLILHGYDCHRPYPHAGPWFHAYGGDYTGNVDALLSDRRSTERVYDGVYYPDFPLEDFFHTAGDPILDPAGYQRIIDWKSPQGVPLSEADIEHLRDHYDGGILAADLQIGRFLSELEQTGQLENTVVILTSDHGEDLHDHGFFNHRATLRGSTTQVPLIIWGAGFGGRQDELAEAIDVVPTLLGLAGVIAPAGLSGRDLLAGEPAPEIIFQEGVLGHVSARTLTHRLLFSGFPLTFPYYDLALESATLESGHLALYDLEADPDEQHNIIAEQPEVAEALRSALLGWRQGMKQSDFRGEQPTDAALKELLRSRGYW